MRPSSFAAALTLCLIAAVGSPVLAQQKARSETLDMEDKDRALVAKESVKQRRDSKANAGKSGGGSNAQCGSVDIGNDSKDKKGSSQIAERQKTVIVTGNVINTANCK